MARRRPRRPFTSTLPFPFWCGWPCYWQSGVVAVGVAPVPAFDGHAVHHRAGKGSLDLQEHLGGSGCGLLRRRARRRHQDRGVDALGEDQGVGHRKAGRRVDQDDIGLRAQSLEQLSGPARGEQLRGVRGERSRRQNQQALLSRDRLQRLRQPHLPQQHRGEPSGVGHIEEGVQARPPQIAVHDHGPEAGGRERNGEVRERRGLPLGSIGTRHLDDAYRSVEAHELDRRAEDPVRLGRRRVGLGDRHDTTLVPRLPVGNDGYETEHGRAWDGPLEILLPLDRVVEMLTEERQADAEEQAEDSAKDAVPHGRRSERGGGPRCRRDEHDAAVGQLAVDLELVEPLPEGGDLTLHRRPSGGDRLLDAGPLRARVWRCLLADAGRSAGQL